MGCQCESGLLIEHCCELVSLPEFIDKNRIKKLVGDAKTVLQWSEILSFDPLNTKALQTLLGNNFHENSKTKKLAHLLKIYDECFPKNDWAKIHLIHYALADREYEDAYRYLRNLLRFLPSNAHAHLLAGRYYLEKTDDEADAAVVHLNKAVDLGLDNAGVNLLLASAYRKNEKYVESESYYRKAASRDQLSLKTKLAVIAMNEKASKLEAAMVAMSELSPQDLNHPEAWLLKAKLHRRLGDLELAENILMESKTGMLEEHSSRYWYELGRVFDKQEQYAKAFDAFSKANQIQQALTGLVYEEEAVREQYKKLKLFFTRQRLKHFPRIKSDLQGSQPVFIMGFPRSGTTLTEQILSSHSQVHGGGELDYAAGLSRAVQVKLRSDNSYPGCLMDLSMAGNHKVMSKLQADYLAQASFDGHITDCRFFTDKMPLNEVHLGLLELIFPRSAKIHLVRHPLDVVLSNFFTELTHGQHQAQSLKTSAFHYAQTIELVDHYVDQMNAYYRRQRYEDLVCDFDAEASSLLAFLGLELESQCLHFHENKRIANTASYAQVNQPLYNSSMARYKPYLPFIAESADLLGTAIEKLGYSI